jgi:hypothetical protein
MNTKVQRMMEENPGMDEVTAYRAVRSFEMVARRAPDVRKAAIAAGRGIYK